MEKFEEYYKQIIEKLEFIGGLEHLNRGGEIDIWMGDDFTGIVLENGVVTYNSSTYSYGCGIETFSFCVSLEDLLNKPNEYFVVKYKSENEKNKVATENIKKSVRNEKDKRERRIWERLNKKFNP